MSAQSMDQVPPPQSSQPPSTSLPPPPPPQFEQPPPPKVESSILPEPHQPTERIEHRPPTPPPSLPSIELEQPQSIDSPAPSEIPPPPQVPLPTHLVQQATPQFQHSDSASSVIAEPPTPSVGTPAPQPEQPFSAPPPQPEQSQAAMETNVQVNGNGNGVEHGGLGMGVHGEGHRASEGQSAVDVLADVAMGEAALDLADFAKGAGSADVQETSRTSGLAEPSPPLKRSFEDDSSPAQQENGYFGGAGAAVNGAAEVESREAKRPRVEEIPSYQPAPSNNLYSAPPPPATLPSSEPQQPSQPQYSSAPQVATPSGSIQPPAPSESPAPSTSQTYQPQPQSLTSVTPQPQTAPSASPAPTPSQGYDPSSFNSAPTLAHSASSSSFAASPVPAPIPSPAPAQPAPSTAAPTMSPSDLHHFPGVAHQSSASPLPPSQPSPALATSSAPSPAPYQSQPQPQTQQQPMYASPNAFAQQPSPYPPVPVSQPQHLQQPSPYPAHPHQPSASPFPDHPPQQQQSPYPPPVASTSAGTPIPSTSQHQPSPFPSDPSQGQGQGQGQETKPSLPPPAPPIAVMTKEQQKHAINLVRNLKRNKNAAPFLKPVDHIALHIPDYYKIITYPMDLGTVEARLQATGKAMTNVHKLGRIYGLDYSHGTKPGDWEGIVPEGFEPKGYRTVKEFKEDLDKIWENCFRYNGPREKNPVSAMAGLMMDAAEKSYRGMPYSPAVDPYPPRHVSPEIKREPRPAPGFIPTIRRDDSSARPKREIHAPAKDLPYLDSADPSLGGMGMGMGGGGGMPGHYQQPHQMVMPGKARNGRPKGNGAQEQLRYCKETIKELFKKTHEAYAYPFYQPVDLAAYPTYAQYVQRPMDLSTIRSKLEHNQYPLPPYDAFEADVRQIFENCYAFNPAGTIVHEWGRQLEAVFEFKWADRPMDDGGDFSEDDGLNVMEQQLQMLAANIEQMRQNKKAQKEAKRYQQAQQVRPMPMPMPKPQKKASAPLGYNPYGMAAPRPTGPKKQRHPGGNGGANHHKKKKRRDDDSDDYYEDDGGAYYGGSAMGGGGGGGGGGNRRHVAVQQEEYVDFEMKRELAVKIVTFEGPALEEAINIIRRGRPDLLGAANQEVELDIDQLDQRTLVALYRYVCPGNHVPVKAVEVPKPAKQQTSNKQPRNQRKNLDEEKEAERIELMEQQLRAFEKSPAEGGALPPTPQAVGAGDEVGGGDQASSDSSDEASSDSDSDED